MLSHQTVPTPVPSNVLAAALDSLARLYRVARDAFEDWRVRHALRREFADLEVQHLLDATLDDVGLSRSQVPALIRGVPRHELFRRMLARLGIPSSRIGSRRQRGELLWTCTTCKSGKACRHWLDSGRTEGYRAFCPNAETLEHLRDRASTPAA
jgi:uncharacterized protein YjiS (DUF1127 family)